MPSLAPRNEYRDTEGGAGESRKREPRKQHAIPDDLHRLRGSNDSDHLFLGRDRDCHDQLSIDLTVGDRAGGGRLHDGVSGWRPVTKAQPQTDVIHANPLFVVRQFDGLIMCEVRIDPNRRLQGRAFQLAPLIVKQCGAYDHRKRYSE